MTRDAWRFDDARIAVASPLKRTSRNAPAEFALTRPPGFPNVPRCSSGQRAGIFRLSMGDSELQVQLR